MTDKDTRALLERACAKAVDVMLSGDDVATVRQGTGHHVVTIRTVESEEREARTIQRRVEHAENVRADTERELSRVADELAHVRETGAAELARASDALASAAAEIDALRAEVTRQTGIAVDHCARADAAERMVAELRANVQTAIERCRWDCSEASHCGQCSALLGALASTAEVAGRWVSVEVFKRHREALLRDMDRVGADVVKARAERDAAIAARDEAVARAERISRESDTWVAAAVAIDEASRAAVLPYSVDGGASDLQRTVLEIIKKYQAVVFDREQALRDCTAAERARDEVGIQLAAAQAEIARLTKGLREVERFMLAEWRPPAEAVLAMVRDVAAGGPSVPGDALAPRITAALEASGIDTANVKGVE